MFKAGKAVRHWAAANILVPIKSDHRPMTSHLDTFQIMPDVKLSESSIQVLILPFCLLGINDLQCYERIVLGWNTLNSVVPLQASTCSTNAKSCLLQRWCESRHSSEKDDRPSFNEQGRIIRRRTATPDTN